MSKSAVSADVIELKYSLAELPTSQHKAGLVGLILVIEHLQNLGHTEFSLEVTDASASIKLSESGLKLLLDELYAASEELKGRDAPLKGVDAQEVREVIAVDKDGQEKTKKVYYYPAIVPRGSFLETSDSSPNKIWIKLWRDMTWQILRGVPATRKPFEDRASGADSSDVANLWKQITQDKERAIDLPSTYFLGAQAFNAERVPFKDNGRAQLLLHFWPLVCQIYVPQSIDREGKRTFDGFALALPDISHLRHFKTAYLRVLGERSSQASGFRPKEAVVEIPEEAGLESIRLLGGSIAHGEAKSLTSDLICGIDVFHMRRDGNNIRMLYNGRIVPESKRDNDYSTLKMILIDKSFRHQRLVNLVRDRDPFAGFDFLLSTLPIEFGLCSTFFAHDAKLSMEAAEVNHEGEVKMKLAKGETVTGVDEVCIETLILRIMENYLRQKLSDKYKLEWSEIKHDTEKAKDYNKRREDLGKECFYAIRSRSESDFINYFASTICSVQHWMSQDQYECLTQKLYGDTEKIRTLCMLALSAKIAREKKENQGDE